MRTLIGLLVGLLGAAYLYATPYIALWKLKQGMNNQDEQVLAAVVDFPSVREGLKSQIYAGLEDIVPAAPESAADNLAGMLADVVTEEAMGAIAKQAVDMVVEQAVTPEGIILIMQKGKLPTLNIEGGGVAVETPDSSEEYDMETLLRWKDGLTYQSLNRVLVDVNKFSSSADAGAPSVFLTLQRENAFTAWRVIHIDIEQLF